MTKKGKIRESFSINGIFAALNISILHFLNRTIQKGNELSLI